MGIEGILPPWTPASRPNQPARQIARGASGIHPAPAPSAATDQPRSRTKDSVQLSPTAEAKLAQDQSQGLAPAQTGKIDHATYGATHKCPYC